MSDRIDELVERAAERATARPTYLGWVLQQYMEVEGVTWGDVRRRLGDVEFEQIALCLRPRSSRFGDDVAEIAARFRVDPTCLAEIVRTVDAVQAFGSAASESGALLAARSRPPDDEQRHDGSNA